MSPKSDKALHYHLIGLIYYSEPSVKDIKKSKFYFKTSIGLGNLNSLHQLGLIYYSEKKMEKAKFNFFLILFFILFYNHL